MAYHVEDAIVAIASAAGGAAQGIVRLSGPGVLSCLEKCFTAEHRAPLRAIRQPWAISGALSLEPPLGDLPGDLYLWPSNRSYTRQPAAEIHTIGSPPLLDAAVRTLCSAGARLAEPGEFTLRAFLAGRLDLTQAEAVLGVIDAGSRAELNVALAQLAGGLAAPLNGLRDRLLDLLAHLEAGLDFVDEDIQFISPEELDRQLGQASESIDKIAAQMSARGELGGEIRVALIGWPNVGKSSLLNALAGGRASIVSSVAGTTRDYITTRTEINGLDCLLIDTAGMEAEQPGGGIEAAAQAMALQQTGRAHLQVLCLDSTRPLNCWEQSELEKQTGAARLVVLTKTDAPRCAEFGRGAPRADGASASRGSPTGAAGRAELDCRAIETSSKTGAGLDALRRAIVEAVAASAGHESPVVAGTAVRCRESLRLAAASLRGARQAAASQLGDELVAAEVRAALDELGRVVGAVYTDDLLDRIFSRFCIGK